MGRKYTGHHVLMIIKDRHITTSLKDTGAIITEHYIDTSRNYQAPIWKHGEPGLRVKKCVRNRGFSRIDL